MSGAERLINAARARGLNDEEAAGVLVEVHAIQHMFERGFLSACDAIRLTMVAADKRVAAAEERKQREAQS